MSLQRSTQPYALRQLILSPSEGQPRAGHDSHKEREHSSSFTANYSLHLSQASPQLGLSGYIWTMDAYSQAQAKAMDTQIPYPNILISHTASKNIGHRYHLQQGYVTKQGPWVFPKSWLTKTDCGKSNSISTLGSKTDLSPLVMILSNGLNDLQEDPKTLCSLPHW